MNCLVCRGRGDAHFHWCSAVGGPGYKGDPPAKPPPTGLEATLLIREAMASIALDRDQTQTWPPEQPTGGGEPPVGVDPAPAATASPAVRPVRAETLAQRMLHRGRALHPESTGRTHSQPEPEYPRAEAVKIARLRDQTAESTPVERWHWLAGEAGQATWDKIDDDALGGFALRLSAFCREHGLPITVKIRDDVLALEGFDEAAVRAALLHPDRVDVRPETWEKDKRYPVLSFRRGDVVVILGLRQPDAPAVIAAYWTSLLSGWDPTAHRDRTGGGGSKAIGSNPSNVKALVKRLTMMGAYIEPEWSMSDVPVNVTYYGNDLGKIPVSPRTSKADVESAWSRCQRRIHAIDQRDAGSGS